MGRKKTTSRTKAERKASVAAFKEIESGLKQKINYLHQREYITQEELFKQQQLEEDRFRDRKPLPPDKWIKNEYFCGSLAHTIYDKLKEEFIEVYENNLSENME